MNPPETAESLLRKLLALNDPKHRACAYIIAVMLERKGMLKVVERLVRNDRQTFIYEESKTGDLLAVQDPGLKPEDMDAVKGEVAELLEHGLLGQPTAQKEAESSNAPQGTPITNWRSLGIGLTAGFLIGALSFYLVSNPGTSAHRFTLTNIERFRAIKMDNKTGETWIVNPIDGSETPTKHVQAQ